MISDQLFLFLSEKQGAGSKGRTSLTLSLGVPSLFHSLSLRIACLHTHKVKTGQGERDQETQGLLARLHSYCNSELWCRTITTIYHCFVQLFLISQHHIMSVLSYTGTIGGREYNYYSHRQLSRTRLQCSWIVHLFIYTKYNSPPARLYPENWRLSWKL